MFHFFKNLLFFLEIMSDQIYIFHLDGGDELVALASKTIYGKAGLQTWRARDKSIKFNNIQE